MNLCLFGGNLVHDPEVRSFTNTKVANFSIAVNRVFKTKDGETKKVATFLDLEAWDSAADTISTYCKKGDYIIVYCSAKNETWQDKETGQNRSKMKFRVDRFEFVPGTKKGGKTEPQPDTDTLDNDNGINDDIPF